MPIRESEKHRYPPEWPYIAKAAKVAAGWRCQCEGECGTDHGGRCPDVHGQPAHDTGKTIIVTAAHRNHIPEDVRPENIAVWCAPCHLRYDAAHHAETRRTARAAEAASWMEPLFEIRAGN